MPKDAFIRARTNADLKERVETILSKLGLNTSDAINLFFYQINIHNGLPFDIKLPNQETLQALKELENDSPENGIQVKRTTLKEFKHSLEEL